MSSRRTRTEGGFEVGGAAAPKPQGAEPDLLETEVDALVEDWSASDKQLFAELLEDVRSELQRELILRAAAARHTPAEIHAFADAVRGMTDGALFDACTLSGEVRVAVTARLRAESDPLYAMKLNGHALSPRFDDDDPGPVYRTVEQGQPRPRFKAPPALFVQAPAPVAKRELGESAQPGPRSVPPDRRSVPPEPGRGRPATHLNEAVQPLGVSYREYTVDQGELTLEAALEAAAKALMGGVPVPVTLGRRVGDAARPALLLQVQPAGSSRAFQLHDPFAQETVWANERDLLARAELPFEAKTFRRITRVALPDRGQAAGR